MQRTGAYLLDTNVVLHATRQGSSVSAAIDAQFRLSASRFRPAICEVTVGELLAFASSRRWGERRRNQLEDMLASTVIIPISYPGVHRIWAELKSDMKSRGKGIEDNDLWIAACAKELGLVVLTMDGDFEALRELGVSARILDARTGLERPA
jgi:tRNA(fMet)-specific endonuclease VapC